MKAPKRILKINHEGNLVEWNNSLGRFELTSRSWNWDDITKGHKRESRRNYKENQKA